ncbi:NUDIX hydrolase [Streptomyces sp. NRRL S-15]|uniref:NUDIX hydrolase n=1 Tax=Streptomyces sp. NRRL S-15 TaxID=1463886 RepID=UPI001F319DA9|nr:NUDIX domain-containing protein [Streptomyces sp. NRRL S-15]
MRPRVSAYAIAATEDSLLLTQLSDASPVFTPGLWHLPGGGIDPGEQPMEALERELYEETGLELHDAHLVDARSYAAHRLGVSWNDSTCAVTWMPLSGLEHSKLSPAAIDSLGMIGARGVRTVDTH